MNIAHLTHLTKTDLQVCYSHP